MLTNRDRRQRHRLSVQSDQGGQSMAEFALTMPLLIALLVGITLLAWVGFSYVSITSAARMGARHMVSYPVEPENPARFPDADAEILHVVTSTMPFLDWRRAEIAILPQPPDSRLDIGPEPIYVAIQIAYPVGLPTIEIPYVIRDGSFYLLPPITLQATSRMRID